MAYFDISLLFIDDWRSYGESSYLPVEAKLDWRSARDHCISIGAHLLEVDDGVESDYVSTFFGSNMWIGATKSGNDVWTTSNGNDLVWTNWAKGQPSGDGRCAKLDEEFKWNDVSCSARRPFLCEQSK